MCEHGPDAGTHMVCTAILYVVHSCSCFTAATSAALVQAPQERTNLRMNTQPSATEQQSLGCVATGVQPTCDYNTTVHTKASCMHMPCKGTALTFSTSSESAGARARNSLSASTHSAVQSAKAWRVMVVWLTALCWLGDQAVPQTRLHNLPS